MGTTVNKMLDQARAWIGCKESNGSHKAIIDIYNAYKPLARNYKVKYSDSWCATFISACAIKCGATDIIPTECSCGNMIELMKARGIWEENDDITPKPGYIIMYDWDKKNGWPEHVGIVEKVSGSTVIVIEGNKNDAVERRTVNVGSPFIRGYGKPNYQGESSPNPDTPQKPAPSNKIAVDGEWGPATTRLAQKVFGTTVDGKVSNQFKCYENKNKGLLSSTFEWKDKPNGCSPLIKAIQGQVEVRQDGHIGPGTIKAMQRYFGTPVDGVCDKPSTLIKAFQIWLNSRV